MTSPARSPRGLRVLHVLCDLSGGGAERLVLDLCKASSYDAEVAVVQDGGVLGPAFAAAGVPVHRLGRRPGRPGGRALLRLARLARGFDVVHTHLWAGDAWGRPAAWWAGVPARVSTEHNVDRDEPAWKHRYKAATARSLSAVVAVSEAVAAYWRGHGVDCEVIENGVDLSRFSAPWVGGGSVLAVGRRVPQKGFDVLAEAMKRLPGVPWAIAGEGPVRPEGAVLLGDVDDVPSRLSRADVLVVPSRWEGFGLVAAEGLAAGVPVVASAVDGLVDVVGDAGLLVPPGDAAALADAVRRVLSDPDLRADLSARGVRRASRWDLGRTARRYEDLYRRCLGRSPGGRTW